MSAPAPVSRGRLLRWTGTLMLLGLVAKVLGLGVQILTARTLGVDPSLDAYVVAQSLPEMLVQVAMLAALAQLLVPTLADVAHRGGAAEAVRFAGRSLGFLLLMSSLLTLAAWFGARPLVRLTAPGFDDARLDMGVRLFRLLIVNLGLGALIYFAKALLQRRRRFELAVGSAVAASFVQVVGVALLAPRYGVFGLAWAAIGLNVTTLLVLSPGLRDAAGWIRPRRPRFDPDFAHLLHLTVIVGVFSLVSVLSFATDRWFASLLPPGSVAILAYAWRFEPIFLVVIAGAAATPLYTELSEAAARQDRPAFSAGLVRGLKLLAVIAFPAAGLMAGLARPLVQLLFERGAFDAASSRQVADVLAVLAPAFAGWALSALLVQALNALRQPRLALVTGVVSMILNFLFDALLYRRFGVIGLALATTAVAIPMCTLMTLLVLRRVGVTRGSGLLKFLSVLLLLAAVSGSAAFAVQSALSSAWVVWRLVAGGLAGGVPLVLGLMALRPPELLELRRRLKRGGG